VHEGGYGVTVTDDGVFVFTRPDRKRIPEGCRVPAADEAERFRGIVAAEGFRGIVAQLNPDRRAKIDANTSRCKWLGERMGYSAAIEAMQFREINAATTAVAPS